MAADVRFLRNPRGAVCDIIYVSARGKNNEQYDFVCLSASTNTGYVQIQFLFCCIF